MGAGLWAAKQTAMEPTRLASDEQHLLTHASV